MTTTFEINGRKVTIKAPDDSPLLWAIRDEIGLTGSKFGCGIGACGACTVHLNGEAVRSCVTPVNAAAGAKVTTIEGALALLSQQVSQGLGNVTSQLSALQGDMRDNARQLAALNSAQHEFQAHSTGLERLAEAIENWYLVNASL